MEKKDFINRLVKLRMAKGVSAREMSISIGQSPSYINNIESGMSYPSMASFFYICDYFDISPSAFFNTDVTAPVKVQELIDAVKGLSNEQLDNLIAIAKDIKR